jgi:hypothetical protein
VTKGPTIDALHSLAFAMHNAPGAHAILLGSGVSRPAGIPTGWQVVLDLICRLAALRGEDAGCDPAAWHEQQFGAKPSYSALLGQLGGSAAERRALLHSYFEPNEDEKEQGLKRPTAAHRAIARMAARGTIRVILTTNFDRLIEMALRDEGVEPVVIASADDIAGAPPLSQWRCTVIKLHGDYLDPRIRNTEAELAKYKPEMDLLLDRIFDEFGLIISGWSGEWDIALRAAFARCPTRRYTKLWVDPGALGERARDLATNRAITVVEGVDADRLFGTVDDALITLAELDARRHPLTPALAAATAKRWLAEPGKNRIRLHDLVMDEVEHACAAAGPDRFPVDERNIAPEMVRQRLERYEALTDPLITLLITFVQWGDDSHLSLWTKAVERLDGRGISSGGKYTSRVWLDLQRYPTLLLLYAGGIAAVATGRYEWMRALLVDAVRPQNGKLQAVGMEIDATHQLGTHMTCFPEYVENNAKGSAHLYARMRTHFREMLPYDERYQRVFDRFEYLFMLWRKAIGSYAFLGCIVSCLSG